MTTESDMARQERTRHSAHWSGPEANPVDTWLHRNLAGRFDQALGETLPQELLDLAARFQS